MWQGLDPARVRSARQHLFCIIKPFGCCTVLLQGGSEAREPPPALPLRLHAYKHTECDLIVRSAEAPQVNAAVVVLWAQ